MDTSGPENERVETIDCEVVVDAPADHVWRVLTSAQTTPEWLGCLNYTGVVGDVFHMQPDPERRAAGDVTGATHCAILELTPPRRFVFSWYFPDTPRTTVSFVLEVLDEARTRVRLTHEGWDQFPVEVIRAVRDGLAGGWSGHVLPALKEAAEGAR